MTITTTITDEPKGLEGFEVDDIEEFDIEEQSEPEEVLAATDEVPDGESIDIIQIAVDEVINFEIGDSVVHPHHGAGEILDKSVQERFGIEHEYLTIKIHHNDMTLMVPTANAPVAGLRRIIDDETVEKVLTVLREPASEMPKNWSRRFKHNREKIKTGDICELAEVVRNLSARERVKGLSSGEKQMLTRTKQVLASELMYALGKSEEEMETYLGELLLEAANGMLAAAAK